MHFRKIENTGAVAAMAQTAVNAARLQLGKKRGENAELPVGEVRLRRVRLGEVSKDPFDLQSGSAAIRSISEAVRSTSSNVWQYSPSRDMPVSTLICTRTGPQAASCAAYV